MSVVLKLVGLADGRPTTIDGQYLVGCDVDAKGGRGDVFATPAIEKAREFPDAGRALEYWKRQSAVVPLRDDGKPNRPLTSYTVEVVHV